MRQLRPFHTPEELAKIYDHPYDHTVWADHVQRIEKTIQTLDFFARKMGSKTVADLSCGDGAIVRGSQHPWENIILSDLVGGGPIELTLPLLEHVDMYVCSETLEHVEDPKWLLAEARDHATAMVLSTPYAKWDDTNPEHYWAWDDYDLADMLMDAGWTSRHVDLFTPTVSMYYTFQIWVCR